MIPTGSVGCDGATCFAVSTFYLRPPGSIHGQGVVRVTVARRVVTNGSGVINGSGGSHGDPSPLFFHPSTLTKTNYGTYTYRNISPPGLINRHRQTRVIPTTSESLLLHRVGGQTPGILVGWYVWALGHTLPLSTVCFSGKSSCSEQGGRLCLWEHHVSHEMAIKGRTRWGTSRWPRGGWVFANSRFIYELIRLVSGADGDVLVSRRRALLPWGLAVCFGCFRAPKSEESEGRDSGFWS